MQQRLVRSCLLLAAISCQTTGVFQVSDSAPSLCFLGVCQALTW